MFAKIIGNRFAAAPKMLTGNGVNVWNPPAEMYIEQGWKPVTFTEPPEAPSGYYYAPGWEEQTDTIVQTWTLTELPDDIGDEEALEIILGGAE